MKTIKFAVFLVPTLVAVSCICYFSFMKTELTFLSAKAMQKEENDLPKLALPNPEFEYFAHYTLSINDFPIGIFTGSVNSLTTGFSAGYQLQLLDKLDDGQSVIDEFKGTFKFIEDNTFELKQKYIVRDKENTLFETEETWRQEKGNYFNNTAGTSNIPFGIFSFLGLSSKEHLWTKDDAILFYFKRKNNNDAGKLKFFPPLLKFFEKNPENFIYGQDGFLESADLTLSPFHMLKIKRIAPEKVQEVLLSFFNYSVPFSWFKNLSLEDAGMTPLVKTLKECSAEIQKINDTIVKANTNPPYLFMRKIITMSDFCQSMTKDITEHYSAPKPLKSHSKNFDTYLRDKMKSFLQAHRKNNPEELPEALLNLTLSLSLDDKNSSFLWTKIIASSIDSAINELKYNFLIEKERKKKTEIHLNIKDQDPGVVVFGEIEMVSEDFKVTINTSPNMQNTTVPLIDGLSFLDDTSETYFASLCSKQSGHIGLDLSQDDKHYLNFKDGKRFIWNQSTKIELAKKFLILAAITPECSEVAFKIGSDHEKELENSIKELKKNIFQDNFLIRFSNNIPKKLSLMPGKYLVHISSTVSKQKLGTYTFSIPADSAVKVLINAN